MSHEIFTLSDPFDFFCLFFFQEYILKGVVNAALGYETGSVSEAHEVLQLLQQQVVNGSVGTRME